MRRGALALCILTVVASTAGCAGSPPPAPDDPAVAAAELARLNAHTDADVAFLTGMIPHGLQGAELTDMVAAHGVSPALRDLAALMDRQGGAEIGQLRGVLRSWNEPVPDATARMTGTSMPGMATPATLERLRTMRGPAFDRLWLQTMIIHHQGAVRMAEAELAAGSHRGARNIAENTISVQQGQIATMNGLLTAS